MKQRESNDGFLNYEGVPTNGCSQLYFGDIDTILEYVTEIKSTYNNEYE